MNDKLHVGKIVNTHGLKGHLKIFPYTTEKEEFADFTYIMIEGEGDKKYTLQSVRFQKKLAVVRIEGFQNINEVEKFKNKDVYILKSDVAELDEDAFIYSEIIGFEVIDETHGHVGNIKLVEQGVAQDLFTVEKLGGGEFLMPCVKAFVKKIDHENKQIIVTLIEGIME